MKYYVNANASYAGIGTQERPFRTITEAAKLAVNGDEILVAPGIYRESVDPLRPGVRYVSEKKHGAVITGAEQVKNWKNVDGNVWLARIPGGVFGDYNPYTTLVAGDWFFNPYPVHTGEVYLNGHAMYEKQSLEAIKEPQIDWNSWEPDQTIYAWYTEQDGEDTLIYANFQNADPNRENVEINVRRTCFHPSKTGVNNITLSGFVVRQAATNWAPPTAYQEGMVGPHWSKGWIIEDCEISDSRCSGISLGKYLQPNNNNKWSTARLKDGTQTERDAICQAQLEGWSKETIGSHIVRRCHIHHCGQTGIVGHLGGVFSIIEDNHIHHINVKRDLFGAEIAGIKMHAAIDVTFRRNHIHDCTMGMWLDWQAQGTRVTQNLFHDNVVPETVKEFSALAMGVDIFVEVSHGPTLIDNNLLLSPFSLRLCTQGVAAVHNLIAGSLVAVGMGVDNGAKHHASPRYTPYHVPHGTGIAGFMTILHGDMRFYNNIFLQQPCREDFLEFKRRSDEAGWTDFDAAPNMLVGTKPYDGYPTHEQYYAALLADTKGAIFANDQYYDPLPVYTGGNVYLNGAQPCDIEQNFAIGADQVSLKLTETKDGWKLDTDLYDHLPPLETGVISTKTLGMAFEPEEMFENPDGTPIIFNADYFGAHRGLNPLPGPFACREDAASPLALD